MIHFIQGNFTYLAWGTLAFITLITILSFFSLRDIYAKVMKFGIFLNKIIEDQIDIRKEIVNLKKELNLQEDRIKLLKEHMYIIDHVFEHLTNDINFVKKEPLPDGLKTTTHGTSYDHYRMNPIYERYGCSGGISGGGDSPSTVEMNLVR